MAVTTTLEHVFLALPSATISFSFMIVSCQFTGFSIEGPSQAKIDCKDNGDGSADVTYWPTAPGEYAVHVLCNDEDIPQAPYMAQIQPATTAFDASKVLLVKIKYFHDNFFS